MANNAFTENTVRTIQPRNSQTLIFAMYVLYHIK